MNSQLLLDITSYLTFKTPSIDVIISSILSIFLLLLSGFASASEIAFFSLSPTDINNLDANKRQADKLISILRKDSERTLATILILNNLVNVTIVMLANYILHNIIEFNIVWLEVLCATVLLTFLLLLFGEIIPKIYGNINSLNYCRRAVWGIMFFRKLFWYIENILLKSSTITEHFVRKKNHQLSINDLEQALELTNKNEIKNEEKMLQGIIKFVDETAKEVMTSRQDIIDLDIHSSFSEVLKNIVENNYSRIPVYQDNEDNIRGILYIKDLLPHLWKPSTFRWQSLIRPPYFVPETKKIDNLLREFQNNKIHIAIVVDEFGGTSGLVTLEDILEEIVGEINDEFDDDCKAYTKLNSNQYIFDGKTMISDFVKLLNIPDDTFSSAQGESDTIAGLLLEIKGEFPKLNEKIKYLQFTFEVLEIDNLRIKKIKITLNNGVSD